MSYFDLRSEALGGIRSLRGYVNERFIGNNYALYQFELRYTATETLLAGQRFAFQPIIYSDLGQVYDNTEEIWARPRLNKIKKSHGLGLVIPWNLATIIHILSSYSSEGSVSSINFMHAF